MTRARLLWVGVLAVAVGSALLWSALPRSAPQNGPPRLQTIVTLSIDGTSVRVAIADTPALRERGLSGYAPLEADEGMLFVFEEDGRHSFWMKDMLFAIDMLWLDAEGRVVHLEKGVSPDTFPTAFTPDAPARYVLEVPAGFCDTHDIRVGSTAILP